MNTIKFTTTIDEDGNPVAYDVSGHVVCDDEQATLGFYSFNFGSALNELIYWTKICPDAQVTYTTCTL